MKSTYWIQDSTQSGSYYDSIGFDKTVTLAEAKKEFKDWQKSFPHRHSRLIKRTDKIIA